METLYRKVKKGNKIVYESAGVNNVPDLCDGIWMVMTKPYSKSMSSLVWKVGDLKRPVDIVTHATLLTLEDDLSNYLIKLSDVNSDEYKDAKDLYGNHILGSINVTNTSISCIASLFIRQIAKSLEEGENLDFESVFFKFRESLNYDSVDYGAEIRLLNKLSEWLKSNGYRLNKDK